MRSILLAVLAVAGLWACGGSSFTEGGGKGDAGDGGGGSSSSGGSSGGGSSSSGGSSGSSSGGGMVSCPTSPPAGGTACPQVGLVCEYGTDANPQCNEVLTCGAAGWSYPPPGGTRCPSGTCPPTYADVPQGQVCSPIGLDCAYAHGQCNCAGTVPVSGPDPVWQCTTPAAGCPDPRPRIGSSCTQEGLSCDYGACTGGVQLQCTGGVWAQQETACPV